MGRVYAKNLFVSCLVPVLCIAVFNVFAHGALDKENKSRLEIAALFEKLRKLPEFYKNPLASTNKTVLNVQEFMTALSQFMEVTKRTILKKGAWLDDKSPPLDIFNLDNNHFWPYLQKLIVKPGSEIALWGDLHGSAHSLMRTLKNLIRFGYLDNDFTISPQHPDFYLVFLGDYVDRGAYGVEVLYLLLRLKIANPERVVIVRGNHEHIPLNQQWNFVKEIQAKLGSIKLDYLQNCFQLMPVALYLGSPDEYEKVNFILCCHGGLEFGYDPLPLLSSQQKIGFEWLTSLNRKTHFLTKLQKTKCLDENALEAVKAQLLAMKGHYTVNRDYQELDKLVLKNIGFLWNDFGNGKLSDKNFVGWVRSWMFGKKITDELLSWAESSKSSLKGVIRGHQHHDVMFSQLVAGHGLFNLWGGKVYTLFSSPASGPDIVDNKKVHFLYDSFVILKTAQKYDEWVLQHWWRNCDSNTQVNKKWQIQVSKFAQ